MKKSEEEEKGEIEGNRKGEKDIKKELNEESRKRRIGV